MYRFTSLLVLALALVLVAGCGDRIVAPEAAAPAEDAALAAGKKLPGADHGGRPLTATLLGENEVPNPGDPDGTGSAVITLNQGQGEVCFSLTVEGIAPAVAAHIHVGVAGEPGPIVVGLVPPTDGSSSGCVEDVDRALIKAIRQNPSDYYVNVHNPDYPAGALRGQLSK